MISSNRRKLKPSRSFSVAVLYSRTTDLRREPVGATIAPSQIWNSEPDQVRDGSVLWIGAGKRSRTHERMGLNAAGASSFRFVTGPYTLWTTSAFKRRARHPDFSRSFGP